MFCLYCIPKNRRHQKGVSHPSSIPDFSLTSLRCFSFSFSLLFALLSSAVLFLVNHIPEKILILAKSQNSRQGLNQGSQTQFTGGPLEVKSGRCWAASRIPQKDISSYAKKYLINNIHACISIHPYPHTHAFFTYT